MILFYLQNDKLQYIKLYDFQVVRVSSPILDLAHFIYTCTDKEFRDKYYDAINDLYYESLSTMLIKLGGCPETQFPKSELKKQWQKCGRFGLAMGIFACPLNTQMYSILDPTIDTSTEERRNAYKKRIEGAIADIIQYC